MGCDGQLREIGSLRFAIFYTACIRRAEETMARSTLKQPAFTAIEADFDQPQTVRHAYHFSLRAPRPLTSPDHWPAGRLGARVG